MILIFSFHFSVIQQIISAIRCNDLLTPVKRLANERHKLQNNGVNRTHSIYRDILFLALTAIGRSNVDLATFHREYASIFDKLTEKECKMFYRNQDLPPSAATIFCRAYFKPLLLPWREINYIQHDFHNNNNNAKTANTNAHEDDMTEALSVVAVDY